jgi:hypothetical protein
VRLPLAIMTSDDTHARTEALLKSHNYFGMQPDQVRLVGRPCAAAVLLLHPAVCKGSVGAVAALSALSLTTVTAGTHNSQEQFACSRLC